MSGPNCLYQRNPNGGQAAVHKAFCYNCEEDATCHVSAGNRWCANACATCAKAAIRGRSDGEITNQPIIGEYA